ncbi:MAG: hypothetical protein COA99_17605, partial [Moraxellaceae bacterium]
MSRVTPWLSWGLSYHTGVSDELKGKANIEYSDDWQGFFQGLTNSGQLSLVNGIIPSGTKASDSSDVVLEFSTPSYLSTGISVQLTPSVKVNMDVKMSTWSDAETLTINFKSDNTELMTLLGTIDTLLALETATKDSISIPLYFEDTWSWSMGVEFDYSDRLTLRMGYEDRQSSIPNNRQTVLIPLSDMNVYATGFS